MSICQCSLAGTRACNTCPNGPNYPYDTGFYLPIRWPGWPTYTRPQVESGWICPKCGSVYGPSVYKCDKCNEKV